jgi:ABC-type protease/lipase transport system fused ATPase/permease subunit
VTVVVITQRPAVLNSMDKLLILRAGRLEAFGPPSDVLLRLVRPGQKAAEPEAGALPAPEPAPDPTAKQSRSKTAAAAKETAS